MGSLGESFYYCLCDIDAVEGGGSDASGVACALTGRVDIYVNL